MSAASTDHHSAASHDHHGSHDHPSYLAHHFSSAHQQFSSAKMGMWIFLATEVLFFGGVFAAYAAYRMFFPEVFLYSHYLLSWKLGATNTVVLLLSSWTMAMAVNAIKHGRAQKSIAYMLVTILCACAFFGVKYVEYKAKFDHHLVPISSIWPYVSDSSIGNVNKNDGYAKDPETTLKAQAHNVDVTEQVVAAATSHGIDEASVRANFDPNNARIFLGLYFFMTGLHGLHVLIGIGVILWMVILTQQGRFSKDYNVPVENVGLYWHIVDLVWIFLFPLLYLVK